MTTTESASRPEDSADAELAAAFEPMDAVEDPAAVHAALREHCPFHRSDAMGHPIYTVSRRSDVYNVLSQPVLYTARTGPGFVYDEPLPGNLERLDPPEHTELRKLIRGEFTAAAAAEYRDQTRALAHELIDDVIDDGAGNFTEFFANPLPIAVLIDHLGVPDEDRAQIKRWSDEQTASLTDPEGGLEAMHAMQDYIRRLVRDRRSAADDAGTPGEEAVGSTVPRGWVSSFALREHNGERIDEEVVTNLLLELMRAGHETTTNLLSSFVWRILQDRTVWQRLVASPELAAVAVEESLRFDPPVLGLCRTNTEPTTLGGVDLPVDTKLFLLYASANRDPDVFPDPDVFSLDRTLGATRRHYSFGFGAHFCLGANLARMTGTVGVEVLLERLPNLRLTSDGVRNPVPLLWGRHDLGVAW